MDRNYHRDMRRGLLQPPLLALFLTAAGCTSLDPGAGVQPPPPDAVMLSFYMRNSSALPYYWVIHGEHDPRWEGAVEQRPATVGCGAVGADWQLLVWQSPSRPAPDVEVVHHTEGEAFGNPDEFALWLSVSPDGTVATGEGVPEWWGDRDVQRCP